MTRELVSATPRRPMTPARKHRIHAAWKGLCGMCRAKLPVVGPTVIYDHMISLELGGADVDSNVQLLCAATCNKEKTRADARAIAKLRRLIKPRKASRRPLRSRGFNRQLRKRMDGRVERVAP